MEASEVEALVNSSCKRSHELFLLNYGKPPPEDVLGQRALLSSKVGDEYQAVKDMPQPKKHKAGEQENGPPSEASALAAQPSKQLVLAGDRKFPNKTLARRGLQLEKPRWHPPWKLMRVISGHLGWVRAVAVDPGNEWFATGSADRTIKIWDLATGTLKLTLTGHINTPRGLAISRRHPYLFSAGEDKMVKCWDLEHNKAVRSYHGHLSGVYCLALHPAIDVLITGGRDSTARIWDIRTKAQIHCLSGHNNTVVSLGSQAPDPQVLTGSMDNTVKMWDLAAGKCCCTLTNHKKAVRAMVLHSTEYSFASASADNIKKWKFPNGDFFQNFSGHNAILHCLALNSDDVLASGGDDGSLYFWDWKTGHNFQQLKTTVQPGSLECEGAIYACAFDQTGSRLITCEADKTVKIWKEDENATEESHPLNWKPSQASKRW